MSAPNKAERERCWAARDLFWTCLDSNNENAEKCQRFRKDFESLCAPIWVKHFDRKRKYDKFKKEADKIGWEMPLEQK